MYVLNVIKLQVIKDSTNVKTGPKKNPNLLLLLGYVTSFNSNLKPSIKGCSRPKDPPVIEGPDLRWIIATVCLSTKLM